MPPRRTFSIGTFLLVFAGILAIFNPSMEDYGEYAGRRLVQIAKEGVCEGDRFSIASNLSLENCLELISSQEQSLSELAEKLTIRFNFGFWSIYKTEIGNINIFSMLKLPGYQVYTVAIGGHFFTYKYRIYSENPNE